MLYVYESDRFRVERDEDGVWYIIQRDDGMQMIVLQGTDEVKELISALEESMKK